MCVFEKKLGFQICFQREPFLMHLRVVFSVALTSAVLTCAGLWAVGYWRGRRHSGDSRGNSRAAKGGRGESVVELVD